MIIASDGLWNVVSNKVITYMEFFVLEYTRRAHPWNCGILDEESKDIHNEMNLRFSYHNNEISNVSFPFYFGFSLL